MDRRSRSTDSSYRSRHKYRRRSISRSRSRSRNYRYNRSPSKSWSRSRSRSRDRDYRRNRAYERDNYKEKSRNRKYHHRSSSRGGGSSANENTSSHRGSQRRSRERKLKDDSITGNNNSARDRSHKKKFYNSPQRKDERSDSYDSDGNYYEQTQPNNTIIVRGLPPHITEADLSSDLMQYNLVPLSIRLIRKRRTGTSRGFAFVEFSIKEEAMLWMQHKQGHLILNDMHESAKMQYSHSKEPIKEQKILSDWYCAKCGVFNFKRREVCFKCFASREESEKGGEGSDEISNILTKKIMLRNLDVLTNEECVLTVMQEKIPRQVEKITKILVCRDPLTQTSRGICYLYFDNLVDSMNTHNSLKALEPPLTIEDREVLVTYCMDSENKHIVKPSSISRDDLSSSSNSKYNANSSAGNTYRYTLADVPRLAEYSASMYASSQAERDYYMKYYTSYYIAEISKGHFANLPTMTQLGETSANSGAAVALSAIQRKMGKTKERQSVTASNSTTNSTTTDDSGVFNPDKNYPPPDINTYQYDETSGYYYDPTTKLYYNSNSQYFYNNDTSQYLYYDTERKKYLVVPTTTTGTSDDSSNKNNDSGTKAGGKHDKVKVAKKIVKDMEKWAKQLNQKKEMNLASTSYSVAPIKTISNATSSSNNNGTLKQLIANSNTGSGIADIGFSILENKEKTKFLDVVEPPSEVNRNITMYNSDSDDNHEDNSQGLNKNEKEHVDFEKLTCLLCKRAFQSSDILSKHLKMSKLHKENLQKFSQNELYERSVGGNSIEYRDRAKERRLKYGEGDPPPINRSKERFEKQLETVTSAAQSVLATQMPINESNVGNRLLQKMGWQEGQGLGKKNQGRTNIIEADGRNSNAGLGSKFSQFAPGDDYKSYIKRMMKSRYEQS